jgi:magnesium-transporting ATPase (P-type)
MVFASIVVMQMANAFECRSSHSSLLSIRRFSNRLLTGAVAIESLMLGAFVYLPPLRRALGQHALSWREWIPVLVTPWLFLAAEETRKAIARSRVPAGWRLS